MKIFEAKLEDVLAINPELNANDAEDLLTLGDPNDTIEEGLFKLYGDTGGECGA
jgi:hypothetical protein